MSSLTGRLLVCSRGRLVGPRTCPSVVPFRQARGVHARATTKPALKDAVRDFLEELKDGLKTTDRAKFKSDSLADELKSTENFGKRGEAFVAGQAVLMGLVVFPVFNVDILIRLLGLGGMGLALAIMISGSTVLGSALSPLPAPRRDGQLVTTGMFKYMRHPLYTGLVFGSLGLAVATNSPSRLLFAVALTVLLSFKAEFEEGELIKKYGKEYRDYQQSTKRFWLL